MDRMISETGQCQVKTNLQTHVTQPVVAFDSSVDTDQRELPDGPCVSPRRLVKSRDMSDDSSATMEVKYAGTFPVVGENQDERMEYVRKILLDMKNVNKTRPVLLAVSLSGIKVCSITGESILMAHALKRISYATCHPEFCQFSFLAREPKAHTNVQHCYVFLTKAAQEAEELNSVVASAFKVAYACQRQSQVIYQPTFNEIIRHQMDVQKEGLREYSRQQEAMLAARLCQISTPLVDQRLDERRQRQQKERDEHERRILQKKERTSWAKKIYEKSSHQSPSSNDSPPTFDPDSSGFHFPSKSVSEDVLRRNSGFTECVLCNSDRNCTSSRNIDVSLEEGYLCPVPCHPDPSSKSGCELGFQSCHHLVNDMTKDDVTVHDVDQLPSNGLAQQNRPNMKPGAGMRASPVALPSCEGVPTRSRPLSGKYQNDEGGSRSSRDCSRDAAETRDIYQGPPTPVRHDSLRKISGSQGTLFDDLQDAVWYQPGVPRDVALEILSQQDIGSFIIRDSTTHPCCYALSVKVPRYDNPSGISHYLVTRTTKGSFKIKGLDKEWPTLSSLVTHHTVMRELLPCLLQIPRTSNAATAKEPDKDMSNY